MFKTLIFSLFGMKMSQILHIL